MTRVLREQYPGLELVVTPDMGSQGLLHFASAGHATVTPIHAESSPLPSSLQWTTYIEPARHSDDDGFQNKGSIGQRLLFGKFLYTWNSHEFIVYLADGRDGAESYPEVTNYYVLGPDRNKINDLILAIGVWASDLHDEILVFDDGYWSRNGDLWQSVSKATWDAVILDKDMKKALIEDHLNFFTSRKTYKDLQVGWKRGIIYHGPPGNGKTISIKATMHMLADRTPSIPSLYVRSLNSYRGPEYGIRTVFRKAREYAPCYLIFEDLDTIITESVRSYFLNEVDGLKTNDGVFMIGSTNHLDKLDPGISKRPSRFDRKYYFPDPNTEQRVEYCRFWQGKLAHNPKIEFPDRLCSAIAGITDKFSFAYMQEAFVAALLAMARDGSEGASGSDHHEDAWVVLDDSEEEAPADDDDDDLNKLKLWVEIKKQVEILRQGME